MDDKLRKLLMMALRSDTNDHEASAAFQAARRMSKDKDVDKLLGSGVTTVVEKVVYRTAARGNHRRQFEISVPASFQFSMLERAFKDGAQHSVDVHMVSCESQSATYNSGLRLVVEVVGDKANVDNYSIMLDGYIDQVREKSRNTAAPKRSAPPRAKAPPQDSKPSAAQEAPQKGFWSKLFGK